MARYAATSKGSGRASSPWRSQASCTPSTSAVPAACLPTRTAPGPGQLDTCYLGLLLAIRVNQDGAFGREVYALDPSRY